MIFQCKRHFLNPGNVLNFFDLLRGALNYHFLEITVREADFLFHCFSRVTGTTL